MAVARTVRRVEARVIADAELLQRQRHAARPLKRGGHVGQAFQWKEALKEGHGLIIGKREAVIGAERRSRRDEEGRASPSAAARSSTWRIFFSMASGGLQVLAEPDPAPDGVVGGPGSHEGARPAPRPHGPRPPARIIHGARCGD